MSLPDDERSTDAGRAGRHGGAGTIEDLRAAIEGRLGDLASGGPAGRSSQKLSEAMGYALLARGKRVRPLLTILTAHGLGGGGAGVLDVACAVEMIHTASLVLDDLPCMDDATTRRGRPTLHRRFGESTAMLVAIALLGRAFEVVSSAEGVRGSDRAEMTRILALAVGTEGLVGGQEADLDPTPDRTASSIADDHARKTGALFTAAVACGACLAGAPPRQHAALDGFAAALGLAFQIRDDILDATATAAALGKDVGQDTRRGSSVALLGRDDASSLVAVHLHDALAALDGHPELANPLGSFVRHVFDDVGRP